MKRKIKKKELVIGGAAILVIAFAAAAGVNYYFKDTKIPFKLSANFFSTESESVKQKKTLYTCSMHPQVMKDAPGSCPICGMTLVPMKTPEHKNHSQGESTGEKEDTLLIAVEPAVIQKMGIKTEILKKQTISREIRSVAHIDFNEKNQAIVNSRVNGWVEKLYVRFTGQRVRRGQALAAIYSPELVSTQEEYLQLYKQTIANPENKELQGLLTAARKRLRYWNISGAQIRRIEERREVKRLLTLYSPYSGVVLEKKVIQGARIKKGSDLFKIVDLSTVWAFVHIPEKDIPFIRKNMRAVMTLSQLPGKKYKGRVSFIFPYMDSKTRDLKIRISFRNRGFQLRPGMYATIVLKRTLPGKHIVAPLSAVIRTGTRNIAFVYRGNGVFEPREVHTGVMSGSDGIQILHGLKSGEAVVTSGQFLLDSETRIQEAVRRMRRGGGDPDKMPGGHQH